MAATTRVLARAAPAVRTVLRCTRLAEVPQGRCPLLAREVAAVPAPPVGRLRRSCSCRAVVTTVPTLPVRHEPVATGLAPATPTRRMTARAACLGEIAQGRCPLLRAEVSTMGSHCLFPPRVGLVFRGPFAAAVCRRGRSRWFLGRGRRLIAPLLPVASMRLPSRDGGTNVLPRRRDLRGRGVRAHAGAHAASECGAARARDLPSAVQTCRAREAVHGAPRARAPVASVGTAAVHCGDGRDACVRRGVAVGSYLLLSDLERFADCSGHLRAYLRASRGLPSGLKSRLEST